MAENQYKDVVMSLPILITASFFILLNSLTLQR